MTICQTALECAQYFQPLIAAAIAGSAAVVSAWTIWRTARLTDRRERHYRDEEIARRRIYTATTLASSIQTITGRRASLLRGHIRLMAASNAAMDEHAAQDAKLELLAMASDWEAVSLLPLAIQRSLSAFQSLLSAHNETMQPGITFFSQHFKEDVMDRLNLIATEGSKIVGPLMLVARGDYDAESARRYTVQ